MPIDNSEVILRQAREFEAEWLWLMSCLEALDLSKATEMQIFESGYRTVDVEWKVAAVPNVLGETPRACVWAKFVLEDREIQCAVCPVMGRDTWWRVVTLAELIDTLTDMGLCAS